jgi:hypothetical protein
VPPQRVQIRLVPDEAEAVLTILDKRAASEAVTDADWLRLFATEGYIRLQKRERSMKRPFEDNEFRTFVLSDGLVAKRVMLRTTLEEWMRADLRDAGAHALAYLPPDATIRAKVYPVIKPQENSFVFEVERDPAIFKYITSEPRETFETIIAHEMHHVGYGTACPPKRVQAEIDKLPENDRELLKWMSAFGEGFATLAAAGGPEVPNPEARMTAEVRDAFAKGLTTYDADFQKLVSFFLDIANGKLKGDAADERGFAFMGFVGPWYTVGWRMDVIIEKTLGRKELIDGMCDQRTLMATYNRAADEWTRRTGEQLPRWPDALVSKWSGTPGQ